MITPEQIQQASFYSTSAGGVLWSLVQISKEYSAPVQVPGKMRKVLVLSVPSTMATNIAGWFVTPGLMFAAHIQTLSTVNVAGVVVGVIFWNVLPGMIDLFSNFSLTAVGAWLQGLGKGKTQ